MITLDKILERCYNRNVKANQQKENSKEKRLVVLGIGTVWIEAESEEELRKELAELRRSLD
jgi:hypothetical protein